MAAILRIGMVAVAAVAASAGCRRLDPVASQPRVVRNVQNLATLALEVRSSDADGRFTGTEEPLPPGEPWRTPSMIQNLSRFAKLTPADDGLFHEQYEVVVDPTGFKGPHMEVIPFGGQAARDAESPATLSRWCQVRAVGQFGRGAEIWEISLRIVAEGSRVTQEPVTARRLHP